MRLARPARPSAAAVAASSVHPVSLLAARRRLRRRYPFWSVHERLYDFYKYYFFQTLSVMGGLMLLALHGPGGLSLDQGAKKSI